MINHSYGLEFIGMIKKYADRLKHYDKPGVIQFLEMEKVIPRLHKSQTVELCDTCKGSGIYYWDELTNYHKGEYDTYSKTCPNCNGSGRMLHIEYKSSVTEPFASKEK